MSLAAISISANFAAAAGAAGPGRNSPRPGHRPIGGGWSAAIDRPVPGGRPEDRDIPAGPAAVGRPRAVPGPYGGSGRSGRPGPSPAPGAGHRAERFLPTEMSAGTSNGSPGGSDESDTWANLLSFSVCPQCNREK